MTYATIALDAPPEERLAFLEAEVNLMHTAVRWLAHERVYPGRGALSMLSRTRAEEDLAGFANARDEFVEKMPDDPATVYMQWLVAEMEAALAAWPE